MTILSYLKFWVLITPFLFYGLAYADDAASTQPEFNRISEAYEDGLNIWLRDQAGKIGLFNIAQNTLTSPYDDDIFIDIIAQDQRLIGLKAMGDVDNPRYALIDLFTKQMIGPVLDNTDHSSVMASSGKKIHMLQSRSIQTLDLSKPTPLWESQTLETAIRSFGMLSMLVHKDALYLGINQGEWGGGLRRINLNTGAINIIQAEADGKTEPFLRPDLFPITSIIMHPKESNCIIAATGISHLFSIRGAAVTVCDGEIRNIYRKAKTKTFQYGHTLKYEHAFYDLMPIKNGWIAITSDGMIENIKNTHKETSWPKFPKKGGLNYTRLENGAMVINSDINGDLSVSGRRFRLVRRIK